MKSNKGNDNIGKESDERSIYQIHNIDSVHKKGKTDISLYKIGCENKKREEEEKKSRVKKLNIIACDEENPSVKLEKYKKEVEEKNKIINEYIEKIISNFKEEIKKLNNLIDDLKEQLKEKDEEIKKQSEELIKLKKKIKQEEFIEIIKEEEKEVEERKSTPFNYHQKFFQEKQEEEEGKDFREIESEKVKISLINNNRINFDLHLKGKNGRENISTLNENITNSSSSFRKNMQEKK